MTCRSFFRGLGLALLFSILLPAQEPAHPNFSGRWRMVKERSDFGNAVAPDIVIRVIDQHDPTMNVHTIETSGRHTTTSDTSYFTSGDIADNMLSGRDATSKSFWDSDTLVIRTETKDSKGGTEVIVDRWELSPDKQTLTVDSHVETEKGSADFKLVCRRDPVKH